MLKMGTAHKIITPGDTDKILLSGMPRRSALRGVMDETEVNVTVLYDGQQYVITCVLDLVFVYTEMEQEILAGIASEIPEATLILSCIHDHSGTAVPRDNQDEAHKAASQQAAALVITQSIAAIIEAAANMREVESASCRTYLPEKLGTCRRAKLSNGSVVTAWGAGPVIPPGHKWMGYSGDDADWIDILAFKEPGAATPRAVMTSYGSHIHFYEVPMVTGEAGGYARARMREVLPESAISYHTAYAGDVALQFFHPMPFESDVDLIEWQRAGSTHYGNVFAECVKNALTSLCYQTVDRLGIQNYRWEDQSETGGRKASYSVQTIKIGETALCSLPGEMFLAWDQELRQNLAAEHVFVIGYNTSWLGYVATPIGFEEGSYECMRGPADKIGYGDNPGRVKSGTTTGSEIIGEARKQITTLFT